MAGIGVRRALDCEPALEPVRPEAALLRQAAGMARHDAYFLTSVVASGQHRWRCDCMCTKF